MRITLDYLKQVWASISQPLSRPIRFPPASITAFSFTFPELKVVEWLVFFLLWGHPSVRLGWKTVSSHLQIREWGIRVWKAQGVFMTRARVLGSEGTSMFCWLADSFDTSPVQHLFSPWPRSRFTFCCRSRSRAACFCSASLYNPEHSANSLKRHVLFTLLCENGRILLAPSTKHRTVNLRGQNPKKWRMKRVCLNFFLCSYTVSTLKVIGNRSASKRFIRFSWSRLLVIFCCSEFHY